MASEKKKKNPERLILAGYGLDVCPIFTVRAFSYSPSVDLHTEKIFIVTTRSQFPSRSTRKPVYVAPLHVFHSHFIFPVYHRDLLIESSTVFVLGNQTQNAGKVCAAVSSARSSTIGLKIAKTSLSDLENRKYF